MALSATVTGFVLAAPVVSSQESTPSTTLDSTGSSSARLADGPEPVVVMGRDGPAAPTSATDGAGAAPPAAGTAAPTPGDVPVASGGSAADGTAASADGAAASTDGAAGTAPPSSGTAATSTSAGGRPAPTVEAEVVALVNSARAGAGCAPLVADEELSTLARAHSADMRDRSFFGHVNPDELDPFQRAEAAGRPDARAENIAQGQPDADAVMDSWLSSSDHRSNILDCELTTIGVGMVEGEDGPFWTQLFGG